jgi:hypothetical protein
VTCEVRKCKPAVHTLCCQSMSLTHSQSWLY